MDPGTVSVNWKLLQARLKAGQAVAAKIDPPPKSRKRKRDEYQKNWNNPTHRTVVKAHKRPRDDHISLRKRPNMQTAAPSNEPASASTTRAPTTACTGANINAGLSPNVEIGRYIALDCEMVGVGPQSTPHPSASRSALARVSIVNYEGQQIYDSYVLPQETVTDWRTSVSGILPKHMNIARTFSEVQKTVSGIMDGRVIIGHSIGHDLEALLLSHPRRDIRDTARHPPYRRLAGGGSPRLKILASELLGLNIQQEEHSSAEDARACMMLFRRDKQGFEAEHGRKFPAPKVPQAAVAVHGESGEEARKKPKRKKKKKKKKK